MEFEALCRKYLTEDDLIQDEPMSRHTSFQAGGQARYFITPQDTEALKQVIALCRQEAVPYFILGKGSNLLVSDTGYDGAVIDLTRHLNKITVEKQEITAQAGASLPVLSRVAMMHGLGGLEFAAGIPGSVGGGCVMNAGAYGGEIRHVLKEAQVLTQEGEILTIAAEDLALGYRTSCILEKEYIVLSCTYTLQPRETDLILADMKYYNSQRRLKQPLDKGSAGSTFKRPEGHFAGKLIQDAGLKGYQVGQAAVSEKHAGFVVNLGGATASDIWQVCQDVRRIVNEQFGINLEMEVKTLGAFPEQETE